MSSSPENIFVHRVGAGDEDLRVALEHVEEAVLLRHDCAE